MNEVCLMVFFWDESSANSVLNFVFNSDATHSKNAHFWLELTVNGFFVFFFAVVVVGFDYELAVQTTYVHYRKSSNKL